MKSVHFSQLDDLETNGELTRMKLICDSRDGEEDEPNDGSNEESVLTRPVFIDFISSFSPDTESRAIGLTEINSVRDEIRTSDERDDGAELPQTTNQQEEDGNLYSERGKD